MEPKKLLSEAGEARSDYFKYTDELIFQMIPRLLAELTRLELVAGGAAIIIMHLLTAMPWENSGFHYLINTVVPAVSIYFLLMLVTRLRILNLFVYLLAIGFLGSMFTVLAVGAFGLLFLWLIGSTLLWMAMDHAYVFLALTFPRGVY